MRWRSVLILTAMFVFPAFTLAQDGAAPGGRDCEQPQPCPEGQTWDVETRTCIVLSS